MSLWVDSWQLECCGEPFEVGQEVSWSAVPIADVKYVRSVLGRNAAAGVSHSYETHNEEHEGSEVVLTGTVQAIEAVRCDFGPDGRPISGTALIEGVTRWTRDDPELRFVAYVVTLI